MTLWRWLSWWFWPSDRVSQAWLTEQDRREDTKGVDQVCIRWPISKGAR